MAAGQSAELTERSESRKARPGRAGGACIIDRRIPKCRCETNGALPRAPGYCFRDDKSVWMELRRRLGSRLSSGVMIHLGRGRCSRPLSSQRGQGNNHLDTQVPGNLSVWQSSLLGSQPAFSIRTKAANRTGRQKNALGAPQKSMTQQKHRSAHTGRLHVYGLVRRLQRALPLRRVFPQR